MLRWYVWPILEVGLNRGPKYLRWRYNDAGLDVRWGWQRLGLEPWSILWADVTTAQHDALILNSDVRALPVDIDTNPGSGAVTQLKNGLEAVNIPAGWVNTSLSYRVILRTICQMAQFAQAAEGMGRIRINRSGVTLQTEWQALPAGVQGAILIYAERKGWDTSALQPTTKLRAIWKFMSEAWGSEPMILNGVTL